MTDYILTFFVSFFGFLFAFIAKDFYDIFFQARIKEFFSRYKIYIKKTTRNIQEKIE